MVGSAWYGYGDRDFVGDYGVSRSFFVPKAECQALTLACLAPEAN